MLPHRSYVSTGKYVDCDFLVQVHYRNYLWKERPLPLH